MLARRKDWSSLEETYRKIILSIQLLWQMPR